MSPEVDVAGRYLPEVDRSPSNDQPAKIRTAALKLRRTISDAFGRGFCGNMPVKTFLKSVAI